MSTPPRLRGAGGVRTSVALPFVVALCAAAATELAWPSRARACVPCSCGDPTLVATGVEQPYRNRVRLALEERLGTHASGIDLTRRESLVSTSSLYALWSPHDRITLGAQLPWVVNAIRDADGQLRVASGLGDLETSGRVVVARDRRFAARHILQLMVGLKWPTGPRVTDSEGFFFADDEQPGSGSFDPFGGVAWSWFTGGLASGAVQVLARVPTAGPRGYRRGAAVASSAVVQLQPVRWFALGLGGVVLWRAADALANGAASPDTGGTVVQLLPAFLFAPASRVLLRLSASLPVVQSFNGRQREGVEGVLSLAVDIR
jgi:hypothetical protein